MKHYFRPTLFLIISILLIYPLSAVSSFAAEEEILSVTPGGFYDETDDVDRCV